MPFYKSTILLIMELLGSVPLDSIRKVAHFIMMIAVWTSNKKIWFKKIKSQNKIYIRLEMIILF